MFVVLQPDLLSSSRTFVNKVDCQLVEGAIGSRGDHVTLFVFGDSLEVSTCQSLDTLEYTRMRWRKASAAVSCCDSSTDSCDCSVLMQYL